MRLRTTTQVYASTIYPEVIAAGTVLFWSIWLLAPWDTFASLPIYVYLGRTANESVFGLFGLGIVALHLSGFHLRRLRLRRSACFVYALFWLFVSSLFILANFRATSTPVYLGAAAYSAWIFFILGGDNTIDGGP